MTYEKMPFGKYKGYDVCDLPTTYITYALHEFDLPDELAQALKDEIIERLDLQVYGCTKSDIDKVYKHCCKIYHPDKGGSTEAMQALNEMKGMLYEI